MIRSKKTHALSPTIIRTKRLLIVLSVLLICANIFYLTETRKLAKSYNEQRNQATWFLFQLTKEFSELVAIAPFSMNDKESHEETKLKYELTWSRFDLILNSHEADNFLETEGAREFFTQLFIEFQQSEQLLLGLKNRDDALNYTRYTMALYDDMIQYVNNNFRIQSPLYQKQAEQAQWLNYVQYMLMIFLFLCMLLVTYILHKEAIYNRQLAFTDPLTGIGNRLAMFHSLTKLQKQNESFTLMLLDLNGFKPINDQFGHQAGDTVLVAISRRLSHEVSGYSYEIYRIGGDEFAIILHAVENNAIISVEHQIFRSFKRGVSLSETNVQPISTSIGHSVFPDEAETINELIACADMKMYQMKHSRDQRLSNGLR